MTSDASGSRPPGEPGAPQLMLRRLGPGAAGVLSLLVASSLLVPIFGLLVAPFAAIPVLHLVAAGDRPLLGWLPPLLVALLLMFVDVALGARIVCAYLLSVVVPVLGVWAWRRHGWSEGRWAAVTVLASAVVLVGLITIAVAPESPEAVIARQVREAEPMLKELLVTPGASEGKVAESLDEAEWMLSGFAPTLAIGYLVWVLFWIRPRLPLLGFPMKVEWFESYRSELWLPAAFIVTGLATALGSGTVRWIAQNLLVAVVILFFVHGLAIIRAHLARWFGRRWHLRWVAVMLSLLAPALVAALGLADSFFELRPRAETDRGNP